MKPDNGLFIGNRLAVHTYSRIFLNLNMIFKAQLMLATSDTITINIQGIFKKYVDFLCVRVNFDHRILYYVLTKTMCPFLMCELYGT